MPLAIDNNRDGGLLGRMNGWMLACRRRIGQRRCGSKSLGIYPARGHTRIQQGFFGRFDHGLGATDEDLVHARHWQEGGDDGPHFVGINAPLQQIHLLRLARQNVN